MSSKNNWFKYIVIIVGILVGMSIASLIVNVKSVRIVRESMKKINTKSENCAELKGGKKYFGILWSPYCAKLGKKYKDRCMDMKKQGASGGMCFDNLKRINKKLEHGAAEQSKNAEKALSNDKKKRKPIPVMKWNKEEREIIFKNTGDIRELGKNMCHYDKVKEVEENVDKMNDALAKYMTQNEQTKQAIKDV
jgi:hypothetical protein